MSDTIKDTAALDHFEELKDSVTQREWLIACNKLGVTRNQIDADYGLLLLILAWVQEKRTVGKASWDKLLDATDEQILDILGLKEDESPTEEPAAEERQDEPDTAATAKGDPEFVPDDL